jgi:hypothetical protein
MSELQSNTQSSQPSPQDKMESLFVNMVLQYTNLAWMCLGKVAYPDSGKTAVDLDSARLMIDQLEMLEKKTHGNLSKQEQDLLAQSLTNLRMNYVEVAQSHRGKAPGSTQEPKRETDQASTASAGTDSGIGGSDAEGKKPESSQEEPRKRFTKKY